MKKNISLWMLGIAAMLASCNQNEELLQTGNELSAVTITAQLGDAISTRATHDIDDDVQRCVVEVRPAGSTEAGTHYDGVVEDGSYKFTLTLQAGRKYDFLFWADDNASYNTTDLTAVTLNENAKPGIAYFGSLINQELTSGMTVELTHAVAKVTLRTTGTLETGKTVTVNLPTYSGFDVKTGAVTGASAAQDFTAGYDAAITDAEVYSFYVLAAKDGELASTTTISCDGESTTLTNVPLQMNYRTVLQGDIAGIGKVNGDITATIVKEWAGDKDTQFFPQLHVETAGSVTPDMIESALAGNNGRLVVTGTINAADIQTISAFHSANAISVLDMGGCQSQDSEIPENSFRNNLTIIILPEGITTIGKNAFASNYSMSSLTLPQSLENIGESSFRYGKLTELVIPAKVTKIEDFAFQYQNDLKTITFEGQTPPSSVNQLSKALPSTARPIIYVPKGCVETYKTAISEDYHNKITESVE